jgi:hypothetical protein
MTIERCIFIASWCSSRHFVGESAQVSASCMVMIRSNRLNLHLYQGKITVSTLSTFIVDGWMCAMHVARSSAGELKAFVTIQGWLSLVSSDKVSLWPP